MTTYTAGFNSEPCLKDFHYSSNKHCQHSQRMLITSDIIGKPIQYQYCIGDEKRLIKDVMKQDVDSLIVWQHDGILKILKHLNIHSDVDTSLYNQVIIFNTNTNDITLDSKFPILSSPSFIQESKTFPFVILLLLTTGIGCLFNRFIRRPTNPPYSIIV